MTDRDAMIQAICTDPRCDSRRLAFADWLEDRGECDLAEFIRVQVELARGWPILSQVQGDLENVTADARFFCLRRRERELWEGSIQQEMCRWIILLPVPFNVKCERGFISSIACDWQAWLRHEAAIYWHEKQTVECGGCSGCDGISVGPCKGTGRIPKPFPATAQPLEEVRLTTWPDMQSVFDEAFYRATCRTCGGDEDYNTPDNLECPDCKGRPLNKWYCDEWPDLPFQTPT